MSFRVILSALLAVMLVVPLSPVHAGNSLIAADKRVAVGKSKLMVTPDREWNRMGLRRVKGSESWTLDGDGLNDITFYGGLAGGQTLFRDVQKKTAPLPTFSPTMLLTDVPTLLEGSIRISQQTSLITIDSIKPARFVGADGVAFTYSFVKPDGLRRKGEARAALVGGKLYMMTFEAPALHYFDRDAANFRSLAETAKIGS